MAINRKRRITREKLRKQIYAALSRVYEDLPESFTTDSAVKAMRLKHGVRRQVWAIVSQLLAKVFYCKATDDLWVKPRQQCLFPHGDPRDLEKWVVRNRPTAVSLNERGFRIGQTHHMAILSDDEVDLLRDLCEEGYSYEWLAKKFEVSIWTVGRICRYERRAQTPTRLKRVHKQSTN